MSSRTQSSSVKALRVVMMTVVLAMLASSIAHAQLHQWSLGFGGTSDDSGFSLARDNSNNIIVTGNFANTITLGGEILTSHGATDVFIAKFDAAGNHLWHKQIGGYCNDVGFGACTDSNGNVIVTGKFCGSSVDFGGGDRPSSEGNGDIFVVKYDSGGNHVWHWTSSLSGVGIDYGRDVCVDAYNDVYVTGCDGQDSPTNDQIFLAKLNGNSGTLAWCKQFGGSGEDAGMGICVSGTDLTITGYFGGETSSSVFFGGDTLKSSGGKDIFLATFSSNSGDHLASQKYGSGYDDEGKSVCVADADGKVFVTGYFQGQIDFGDSVRTADGEDIFLLKMSQYGGGKRYTSWSKTFGEDNGDWGESVATAADGAVYITGYFEGHVNFGGDELFTLGASDNDAFVAKFDASGNHLWSRNWGGCYRDQHGMDIAVASDGYLFVTGNFLDEANLGGPTLTSNGGLDVFLAKYSGADAITGVSIPTTFDAGTYTWDADVTFTSSAPVTPEVWYSISMDCLPCHYLGDYSDIAYGAGPNTSHSIPLSDLKAATSYCYKIRAYASDNVFNYLYYGGSLPLTNSYTDIYGIAHSFNATSCRISVGWYTKYPSKNNKLYYRKTGTTTWSTLYAAEKECNDPDYIEEPNAYNRAYVGFFSVQEGTSYQFKISTQINGSTYVSSIMSESAGHCDHNPPIPREETSPRPAEVAAPFVRAYPNPFNPTTTVSFNVPASADVELTIYGADGGYVRTLASGAYARGVYSVGWDGTNARGDKVSSGIYFVKFKYGEGVLTSKVVLLK